MYRRWIKKIEIVLNLNKCGLLHITGWLNSQKVRAKVRDKIYCDQPFVSETMRCESVDFIQTIDGQNKMFCAFMWKG
jgi:hypothetical protein